MHNVQWQLCVQLWQREVIGPSYPQNHTNIKRLHASTNTKEPSNKCKSLGRLIYLVIHLYILLLYFVGVRRGCADKFPGVFQGNVLHPILMDIRCIG